MLKNITLIILTLILVGLVAVFVFFYKSDLGKQDLADTYINEESEFAELPNGATMHYRDEGNVNGPVLVMVHGGFGSLHNWAGWVHHLRNNYRLISMDLLGHGLTGKYPDNIYDRHTERDAVHQLLQKLGVNKYTLAGNSFGGGIALELALKFPNEVEGLILLGSEGVPNSDKGYDASLFNSDKPETPDQPGFKQLSLLESVGSKFIGPTVIKSTLDKMTYNKSLLTEEYVDYFGRILRYQGNREAQLLMFRQGFYLISKNDKLDLLPRLKEINCPTLIIQGSDDVLVPLSVAEKFNDNIATSELVIIDQAGHMPMIEKPEESASVVIKYFAKYHTQGK